MTDQNWISLYVAHVQSADKVDESRNSATRSYGALCAILTVAILGSLAEFNNPLAGILISILLVFVSTGWLFTINSLTARLSAKHEMLCFIEQEGELPVNFLAREEAIWKEKVVWRLQRSLRVAPMCFQFGGGILFIASFILQFDVCLTN